MCKGIKASVQFCASCLPESLCAVLSRSVNLMDPLFPQDPLSMVFLQARILEWVVMLSSRESSGTEPRSSALQMDPLPSEPSGKPMNTGVGSLSLLQAFFLTQESN